MGAGSKRAFDADLRELAHPPPMTLDEALASDDPVSAIGIRLVHKKGVAMSIPEKVFCAVSSFTADVLNGGLPQALANDPDDLYALFAEFAQRYGTEELKGVLASLAAAFPGGSVPADRDERAAAMPSPAGDGGWATLTERFAACEAAIGDGLLALVENNREAFVLPTRAGSES